MDPLDYMLSNNHHRPSGHYDPVHSASNHWAPHSQSQNSPPYPWPAQRGLPQIYPHHYAMPPTHSSGPDLYGHHATMLPPMVGMGSAGSIAPGSPRPNGHAQSYRSSMPVPVAPIPSSTGNHSHDAAFANQIPAGRPPDFQPPVLGLGMPPLGPGQPEVNSMHRSAYTHVDAGTNSLNHSNTGYFPHFLPTPLPPHPYIPTSTRRGHFSAASLSSRPFGNLPSPTRHSPPSSGLRRSHPRQRRRIMSAEFGHDDNEDEGFHGPPEHILHSPGNSDSSPDEDDIFIRQMQLARGSVTTKMVASKLTLQSLQSVKIEDLSEADRSCVICYNEYGVETPEGINEAPLRLPKCGHVFGDHCIKKWFEDSDSCPYCRDRLHSEPKPHASSSATAFLNLMRSRGVNIAPGGSSDEALARVFMATYGAGDTRNNGSLRYSAPSGRRSPLREGGEHQHRRLRPRHSSSTARETFHLPENRSQGASIPPQPVTTGPGLPSMRQQNEQSPTGRQTQEWRADHAQGTNEVSTTVQEHRLEAQSSTGAPPPVLPVLVPYATEDVEDQHSSVRTLRNPLQVQTGAPFEGLGNNETAPDMTYHGNRRW
ncbi:putative RING finger protein C2A9.04c [Fusarium austroafricanum]|uniref:Putative RING finger protein C2A9.04c n=1 Tax=Fusarium austroafricanum TaxID=2364996 RepID=A0A8H4KPG9_9HYPO|nr:putative RING finger protein C2A9.04c [Fusarium austroafricanum]